MALQPVTLRGNHVQLEPYGDSHITELWAVGNHEELWRYMPFDVSTREKMAAMVHHMIEMSHAGIGIGFAQRDLKDNEIVGGTCFLSYDAQHRRVEIGATWITPKRQRTAVNTDAKLVLLTHAFESLDCIRVEFKTDALNVKSQKALDRIGAVREGTLRAHMIMLDGRYRDTIYYSIIRSEWPAVKERLTERLRA